MQLSKLARTERFGPCSGLAMSLLLSNDFASQRAVTEEEDHLGLK